jgi:putative MATE family efflux protein
MDMMITDDAIFEKACLYVLIICFGVPASSVYNFGAAILRSVGDSKTPLIILSSSGLLNVALNLVFVMGCGMSVSGVATATIISQYASAIAVVTVLMARKRECYHFDPRKMTIDRASLLRMLSIGIPAGLQSSAYSISNLFIIKGVNTFDRPYISANTIAGNVDNILYVSMVAFTQAAMTAVGQNYGAGKKERINKTLIYTLAQAIGVGLVVSTTIFILKENLVALYVDSNDALYDEVVAATVRWISFFIFPYMICGVFEVLSGFLRGLGNSTSTMIIVLTCCCLTRILWVSFVFPYLPHEIESLIWCYPISWSLSVIAALGVLIYEMRRLGKTLRSVGAEEAQKITK